MLLNVGFVCHGQAGSGFEGFGFHLEYRDVVLVQLLYRLILSAERQLQSFHPDVESHHEGLDRDVKEDVRVGACHQVRWHCQYLPREDLEFVSIREG